MKKRWQGCPFTGKSIVTIILAASFVTALNGCGTKMLHSAANQTELNQENQMWSEVSVKQGEADIALYELFVWGYDYDEESGDFMNEDGPRLHNEIREIAEELPAVSWDETCSVQIPEDLQLIAIDIFGADYQKQSRLYYEDFDEDGKNAQRERTDSYEDFLQQLPEGIYYIAVEVIRQGDYIEAKDEYESSCWQYAFRLEIDG